MTPHRAEALIDLSAIEHNVRHLMSTTGRPALAVVKADAYGHGLVPVAQAALRAGATWLGTALLEEALALRSAGITTPVLAWLTPIHEDFESALIEHIDLAIPSLDHLNAVVKAAEKVGKKPRIHLEVDTGMSRGGALGQWRGLLHAVSDLHQLGKIDVIGIWSHFARADEPGNSFNDLQVSEFEKRVTEAEGFGIHPEILHMSNSAASLNNPDARFDLIRLGIAMYGLSPDVRTMGDSTVLGLRPAMSVRAQIHLVKEVPAGAQVGYGGTAILYNDSKLAVIAMGYADGVPRNANSEAGVLIGNHAAPIIGRVSMDQFVVDLGKDSNVRAGEWAYLFGGMIGNGNQPGYTADAWARACGTINYEIVTRIGPRVKRIYI